MTFDTDTINNIKFAQGFRGYDTAEVDEFLDDMTREIEKLNNTIKALKEDLAKEKRKSQLNQQEIDRLNEMNESLSAKIASADSAPAVVEQPKQPIVEEPQPVVFKKPLSAEDIKDTPEYEDMKQVLTDTLLNAQQHAEKLVKDAQERANALIEDGERKAQDRVVSLNVEISENEKKLNAVMEMVSNAKQRFIREFKDQINALDSIEVNSEVSEDKEEAPVYEEPEVKFEFSDEIIFESNVSPNEEQVKQEEKPAEEIKTDTAAVEDSYSPEVEVNKFDFAAVKKSLLKEENFVLDKPIISSQPDPKPEPTIEAQVEEKAANTNSANEEDENQQYIELALSAYNDNKHHNTDYPNTTQNDIKINEDDDQDGIYQPENRSVLSSVIEDILNNKKND